MSDQRITQLTALVEADVAYNDVLPIVDIGASQTKKVTVKDLAEAGFAIADAGSLDIVKIDQASATKLGTTALANSGVTYAKIQNVSATDRLLGRSTAGAGVIEEIILTAAGRALLDDADATTQRATLGLGSIATQASNTVAITGGSVTGITDITIADGGTGSSTASGARTSLGVAIGTDVQAYDAGLQSIAALTTAANKGIYTTALDTYTTFDLTAAARALLDDGDAPTQRTTLGLGSIATQNAGAVAITGGNITGLATLSSTTSTLGTATITGGAITGITDLAVADGGTGASTASTARTNLGVAIGTDVQAYDAGLQSIAGLTTAADQAIYTTGLDAYAVTGFTAAGRALIDDATVTDQRNTLGLGTIATQSASAIAITGGNVTGLTTLASTSSTLGTATITGGTITGITDITVADGGTGASSASAARTNLGVVIGTDVQAYDAGLQSIAGLTTAANKAIYTTASDTYATTDLSVYGRSLIDDADAATARTTLGLGSLAIQSGTFSGTHSGTSSGTNTGDQTITLTGDVTGTGTGSFATTIANNAVNTAKIIAGAITPDQLATSAVTGAKLAADSSTVVSGSTPAGSGAFTGQQWLNTNTGLAYVWTGAAWQQTAALQTITFADSTPLAFSVTKPTDFSATITTTLESQAATRVFIGPVSGANAAPTFRALVATDLPIATSGINGAVQPGTGLAVSGTGVLNHSNVVATGVYTKVTVDAQGHVSAGATLVAADVPNLDVAKITTGTFASARLGADSVTDLQLADYSTASLGDTFPTASFIGQIHLNPLERSFYMWDGNVWVPIGISAGQILLAGTFDASSPAGVGQVESITPDGASAGFVVGDALPVPTLSNNKYYFVVSQGGTITSGNAPNVTLTPPDLILSVYNETNPQWVEIDVSAGAGAIAASNVSFNPVGEVASSNVQTAIAEVSSECRNATNITSGTLAVSRGGTGVVTYTKGELLAASAATTLTALTVGTNGQVLRANSSAATGLEWGVDYVGTVTSVTGTAPIASSGGTTPAISIAAATTSVVGAVQLSDSTSTTSSVLAATPTAVKAAYDLAALALPNTGGIITGNLEIGTTGTLTFEGSSADGFETTLTVANPTADNVVTLPDTTGTVALTSQLDDGSY